ncbi:hypothetical protein COY43_02430 [Candidatus Berkelbacteria bacterium CG_4_10_14_0_8_um_filter_35_9_33_8]|uniref:Insulinase family protein n=1 Tax=Candidatus Berkelbacteria bacterium CG_4_10_14_0_2_um_filter_35_9_33_12 TaxID=1974499 RepID=A0A2M7W514_9BACT|nr:MAG: hypothetical protein COX10_01825 [Candidatus Berkelbacteria bacterium CG23_combo_of_CG06-09_8_20_14_all_33_15]PIS08159.1 MAG: hypothetical protein COT76_02980 [Candidatus Berkelbacteria bacterium CG10_big_fil_rev_8_21_14_0_10_33_10]PIZ28080.1 MAG: hypothetical protein COY43_02430 [Candidatus Berkelbacteria bacterium CG_4_10_14_0_8_um_filter_35_9_33_8]PJA20470.1 MAG: hypothetical protein COX60_01605 [Candidatus Berkelbacteria bacterium CG_4_10_14_0_2_um_filter_35_9_33_12]
MTISQVKLPNNLPIYFFDKKDTQAITVIMLAKVGSRYENDKQAGISHLLEHMFFKGTKKYPHYLDLTKYLDEISAEHNAFTNEETTAYYIKTSYLNTIPAVEILCQMLLENTLNERELKKEKEVIVQEMKMYLDQPARYIYDLYKKNQYGNCPLGRNIIGTVKSVKTITTQDLRNYIKKYYTPSNLIFMLAGKIDEKEKIVKLISQYFAKIMDKPILKAVKFIQSDYKKNIYYYYKKTDQTNIIISYPGYKVNYEKRYELSILQVLMGGMMSSRLFSEVREKRGLAYRVGAEIDNYSDTGAFLVSVGLDPNKAGSTIKLIKKLMPKAVKISDKEFQRAKQKIISNLALQTEDASSLAFMFLEQIIYHGKIITPEEKIDIYTKIKKSDVEKEAGKLFVHQPKITIIGPKNIV